MRPFHAILGLVALGLGLAGWATLGQAQPKPSRPAKVEIRGARPKPIDDPADYQAPVIRNGPRDTDAGREPARASDPLEIPDLPASAPDPAPATPKPAGPAPKPAAEPENARAGEPAAHQEPSVRLEWLGPASVKAGSPAEYSVVARNTAKIPLHLVTVQVRVPAGARVAGTEPKAEGTASALLWELGTLSPGQQKTIKLRLVPPKGEMLCQAWVTFTGASALRVQAREPRLDVALRAPATAVVGDPVGLVLAVSNPGDHPTDGVKVTVRLGAGLEPVGGAKDVIDIGTVGAGETREVKVPCVAKAAGPQRCEATAEGEAGLKAAAAATVAVTQAKLNLEVTGPKLRYLDRKAVYLVKLTNPGDAPAGQATVSHVVPSGFKFVAADAGGKYDPASRTVRWAVGDVGPGESKELKCQLTAAEIGNFNHVMTAAATRGAKVEKAVITRVEGLAAIAMEMKDTADPLEVGTDTTYEIRIANTGSKDETDVKLVCSIPPQMKFKSADGPGRFQVVEGEVTFEPLKRLPASREVVYKVTVTAQQKGDARFKATLTAGNLTEPVIQQESTRVYAD